MPVSLCLPFIDPSGSSFLTKVTSSLVILSQSLSSMIIIVINVLLFIEFRKSKILSSKSINSSSRKVMAQLVITSTSNITCWLPANAVYLSAMIFSTYPIDLVIWTTVIIMPINSIINPSVFLITNLKNMVCFKSADSPS